MTAEDQLYEAVRRWVEENGGKLVVVGGIELHSDPWDSEFKFKIAVRCTGRQPTKPADQHKTLQSEEETR